MHSYEEYNEPIQKLISLMKDDYPNDFILEINSFSATIKSNLSTRVFLEEKSLSKQTSKSTYSERSPKKSKVFRYTHK